MSQDLALLLNNSNKNIVKYLQLALLFPIFYFLPQKYEKLRSKMCLSGILLCLPVIIPYIILYYIMLCYVVLYIILYYIIL